MKDPIKTPARKKAKPSTPGKHKDSIRVFFALWPDPAIQQKLHKIAEKYQPACNARVMRADTLHMTLQFIGNIERQQLPRMINAGSKITGITPFEIELDALAFWKHNRIGYAALNADVPELEKLVTALQQNLANENIASDNTKFSPHVTLLRNVERTLPPQDCPTIKWPVNSFVLIESLTNNQKTEYRPLKEWSLT